MFLVSHLMFLHDIMFYNKNVVRLTKARVLVRVYYYLLYYVLFQYMHQKVDPEM